jgi:hypothetical protein
MIITYFRSSSYNTHSSCEHQYFMEYVLGWRGKSGLKADKGTIVHKVLEILAFIKYNKQNKEQYFTDDIVGTIDIKKYDLDKIINIVYDYYSLGNPHHKWTDKDRRDCKDWTYKTIDFNNGMFDPRNREIVCPEQKFDFEIKKPWAKYTFDTPEGKITGHLALKGTVDLITKVDDGFYEIIDWKTGRRKNWTTGEEKTQEVLQNDPQLKIYHYAVQHLYPDVENIMVTINYINDGGPFSICFDKNDLLKTESMIRDKFEKIKHTTVPRLHKSWMCNRLCHFGKNTFDTEGIDGIIEYRRGQTTPLHQPMTMCEQIKHDVEVKGIDEVVKEYTKPNFSVGHYKAPGSIE